MPKSFPKATHLVLDWLIRSIQVTGGKGSAAYHHLWRGWGSSYPETTGYIIETLWDYHPHFPGLQLDKLAEQCTNWLLDIQRKDGFFPGGLYQDGRSAPIVFDSGQILFGLLRSFREIGKAKYKAAAQRSVNGLIKEWELSGNWLEKSYVQGYEPSYNIRVLWSLLEAKKWGAAEVDNSIVQAIFEHYWARVGEDAWVEQWAFQSDEAAFTHTIAYTWRGFLESALLLNDPITVDQVLEQIHLLLAQGKQEGRWAGRYQKGWQGDFSFICVVGQAQLALLFWRCFELTKDSTFELEAKQVFETIRLLPEHWLLKGGVPGSWPYWGPYQRFRCPNWAVKFWLDAELSLNASLPQYH